MQRAPFRKLYVYILVSSLLSLFFCLSRKIVFSGNVADHHTLNRFLPFALSDVGWWLGGALAIGAALCLVHRLGRFLKRCLIHQKDIRFSWITMFIAIWCLLVLLWSPYLLTFAPGSVLADSHASIRQALYDGISSNHHPVFYTMLVGLLMKAGLRLGSMNMGVLLYTVFQTSIMAGLLSASLAFLYRKKIRAWFLIAAAAFYGLTPIFPSYAIAMWKDPLFSVALAAFSFVLYGLYKHPRQFGKPAYLLLLAIVCLLVIFLRNNGLYVVIAVFLSLLVINRAQSKRVTGSVLGVIVLSVCIQGPLYSHLNIAKPSAEALGVPLQQLSYVAVYEADTLTAEEKEQLDRLLPFDTYGEAYAPCLADQIKFHPAFNKDYLEENQAAVLRLWLKLLPKHFPAYVKAYCLETFGFWHPTMQNSYGYIDQYIIENPFNIHGVDAFEKLTGRSIKEQLLSFRPQLGSGTLAWIMLLSMALNWGMGKKKSILFYLPGFFGWFFILVATPVAFSLRYVYVLCLLAPIYVVYPFLEMDDAKMGR